MNFSSFANLLKPIIGGSDNTVEFTRKLFIAMIGENNSTVIEDKSDDSFKAYFNGNSTINGIAKEISPVADLENFVAFLEDFGDSVSEKLCEAFSGSLDEINLQNINYKIACCFDEIIKKAATTQRKSSSTKDEPLNIPTEQVVDAFPYTETDKELLTDFTLDYDEIMLTLIGGDYAKYLIDMSIPNKIKKLYQEKWKEKANNFINPNLKSYIYGLLGIFDEISNSFISCNSSTLLIKNQRNEIRKLYIKLHPETYDTLFPYDALIDDWNNNDF